MKDFKKGYIRAYKSYFKDLAEYATRLPDDLFPAIMPFDEEDLGKLSEEFLQGFSEGLEKAKAIALGVIAPYSDKARDSAREADKRRSSK